MENEELINNIKSKHILHYILNYIEDKNFKYKLFLYSKKLQIKYDVKLIVLKENYLKKLKFDFDKYLYIEPNLFQKDILSKEYNNFLIEKKLDKERIENILYEIFEKKEIKDIDEEDVDKIKDHEKLINIESPLFMILSKTRNFGKIFTIYISQKIIDKHKLKDEYKKFFDKLNKLNIEYESIFYDYKDINNINYLKQININFNKIKKITLAIEYDNNYYYYFNRKQKDFLEVLFSFKNIVNNLIYLDIKYKYYKINIPPNLFENINNFKSLRYLFIENVNFKEDFILKLNELKL